MCQCGLWVGCKCMKFVAASWCMMKYLRLDEAIRNLVCGDSEILLVDIRPKKAKLVYFLDLFVEGEGVMVLFSVCEAPLDDYANCGSIDDFFTYGEKWF